MTRYTWVLGWATAGIGGAPLAAVAGDGGGLVLDLVPCTVSADALPAGNRVTISVRGGVRIVDVNGIPDHDVGAFPNGGNPHPIRVRSVTYRVPVVPSGVGRDLGMSPFGVALNGVVLDPNAAEWWGDDRASGWQYEPMSGLARTLGLDCNLAHVQPDGSYHYHGLPGALAGDDGDMVHVGYAADGFPIYGPTGHADPKDAESPLVILRSSYRVKTGQRPSGPGGSYDGSFVQDYVYVEGTGELDECNGRVGPTPEHGVGYHYVLTETFPFVPRCFRAEPDPSFLRRGPPPRGKGPPPRGKRPPPRGG